MPEKKTLWRRKGRDRDDVSADWYVESTSSSPSGAGPSRGGDPFASASPPPGRGGGDGTISAYSGDVPGASGGGGGGGGGSSGSGGGWFDLGGDDFGIGLVILLAVGAVLAITFLLTTVVFPILVIGIEIMIVLVVFLAGLAGRLLFRKPWTVRAKAADGRTLEWHVRGFRASGRVRDEVVAALRDGQAPQPAGAEPLAPRRAPVRV